MKRLLFALALSACGAASARADEFTDEPSPESFRTPQRFMLELKGGAYSPNIDATPGLHGTPFADEFDNQLTDAKGKRPVAKPLFAIEFDYQFWHKVGSLGVGASVGFYRRSTHALQYANDAGSMQCSWGYSTIGDQKLANCMRSGDQTSLTIFPITLEAIYRFDYLALRYKWRFPLVPYVKAGLAYYFWFMQRGDSSLAYQLTNDGNKAIGGTLGLVLHPGVSLMLDAIDEGAARALDSEMGINHVHVFIELAYGWITGLGEANKMVFSDTTWNTGLGFEF